MKKMTNENLTSKMLYRMIKELIIGVVTFLILSGGATSMFQEYLLSSGYFSKTEQEKVEKFQEYVDENKIKITDTKKIRNWIKHENIHEFVILKGTKIYFDNRYEEDIFPGSIKNNTFNYVYPINFADGQANLYVYDGFADKYYDIISGISVFISIIICILIFGSELQSEIKNIQYLQKRVKKIGDGELEESVSIKGQDEICQLASGIDSMRNQLLEQKRTQEKMKKAQDELVLGMAHDMRTPLTGLFSYLEIIKKMENEGKPAAQYAKKAFEKAEQLRSVSDQLFEYFLVSNETNAELEEAEIAKSAFEDYLSEFCAFLECNNFKIDVEDVYWHPVKVRINTNYFGRIMNNLMSNMEKYGEKEKPVYLKINYAPDYIGLDFQNEVIKPNPYVKGTGIGLKNIELMMKQMHGYMEVTITEDTYRIVLNFPVTN